MAAYCTYRSVPSTHILPISADFVVAVPRVSTQDDEYEGLHIPKGSTLIGNGWCVDGDSVFCGAILFKCFPGPSLWIPPSTELT
jgi:hypothetical protein